MDDTESQITQPIDAGIGAEDCSRLTADIESELTSKSSKRTSLIIVFLLGTVLSVAATLPFFFMGKPQQGESRWQLHMPDTDDMWLHLDQMKSFYNGLAAGEVYPRWEEDTNRGFGAPTTSYYPPGIYYLTSGLFSIFQDWLKTLLVLHVSLMLASASALYLCARRLFSRQAAMLAMAVYIIFPYHLIDQYYRAALAELMSFVLMPLILLLTWRLFGIGPERNGSKNAPDAVGCDTSEAKRNYFRILFDVGLLAVSYGAFFWSHPPTAYQFSLVFGPYVVALAIWRRQLLSLLCVSAAIVMALGLAAAYLYPAALEAELIRHEYVSLHWPYHESYVFPHTEYADLHCWFFSLLDNSWIISLIAISGCAPVLMLTRRRSVAISENLKQQLILLTCVGIVLLFLMTRYSMPLGKHIPKLEFGGFSWRMLTITTLIVALFAGAFVSAGIDYLGRNKRTVSIIAVSAACLILIGSAGFSVWKVMWPQWNAEPFQPEPEHFNYVIIPRTAPDDVWDLPGPGEIAQAELEDENGVATVKEWKPQHREVSVEITDDDTLWIRTFNFPGWTASVDGGAAEIQTGEDMGDIGIDLTTGRHTVKLDYLETPTRRRGTQISTAAAISVSVALIIGLVGLVVGRVTSGRKLQSLSLSQTR